MCGTTRYGISGSTHWAALGARGGSSYDDTGFVTDPVVLHFSRHATMHLHVCIPSIQVKTFLTGLDLKMNSGNHLCCMSRMSRERASVRHIIYRIRRSVGF